MNPYGIDLTDANTVGPTVSLKVLYEGMPKTSGCESCGAINGDDNEDWCCQKQNPSMYYVEFFYAYQDFEKWGKEKRLELILRAMRNYLDNSPNKGCIFYDKGCTVYDRRPFACRMYGVVPEENWKRRWESLKDRQGDNFSAIQQCNLVTANPPVFSKEEDKWYEHTKSCESRLGMPKFHVDLHDEAGGSYRTFHDHLLLEIFGQDVLANLTKFRMSNPSKEDIDLTIDVLSKTLGDSSGKTISS